jgi:hypothetical protein
MSLDSSASARRPRALTLPPPCSSPSLSRSPRVYVYASRSDGIAAARAALRAVWRSSR